MIYGLTDNKLQMFKKLFNYANPSELWNDLMYTDEEKYVELLNDLKIKQKVLNDIKTGTESERLVNLVNTVEDILDNVRGKRDSMVQKYLIQKVKNLLHKETINKNKD